MRQQNPFQVDVQALLTGLSGTPLLFPRHSLRTWARALWRSVYLLSAFDAGRSRLAEGKLALQLSLANQIRDRRFLCILGEQAQEQCSQLAVQWKLPTLHQRRCLRRLTHNLGAEFYEAQFYGLARPFFERAIDLGSTTPFTYLWLAACVWILQRDEPSVCVLLQQARARTSSEEDFQGKLHTLAELHGCGFE